MRYLFILFILFILLAIANSVFATIDDPEYWYKFESSGEDSSTNEYDLTPAGTPTYTEMIDGNGTLLNGSTQYFYTTQNGPAGDFSISCIVNMTEDNDTRNMIVNNWASYGSCDDFLLAWEWNNDQIMFNVNDGLNYDASFISISSNSLTYGTDYLIIATWDNTAKDIALYIYNLSTNLSAGSTNSGGTVNYVSPDIDLYVGRRSSASSYFFDGKIDDLRIFYRKLSAGDITELTGFYFPILISGTLELDGCDNTTAAVNYFLVDASSSPHTLYTYGTTAEDGTWSEKVADTDDEYCGFQIGQDMVYAGSFATATSAGDGTFTLTNANWSDGDDVWYCVIDPTKTKKSVCAKTTADASHQVTDTYKHDGVAESGGLVIGFDFGTTGDDGYLKPIFDFATGE